MESVGEGASLALYLARQGPCPLGALPAPCHALPLASAASLRPSSAGSRASPGWEACTGAEVALLELWCAQTWAFP